jgi:nucleotide-binding universal stress UspA family protein
LFLYQKILIPLDGSNASEQVLPYARALARKLHLPVQLLAVVDDIALAALAPAEEKKNVEDLVGANVRSSAAFLEKMSTTFHEVSVSCTVEKGTAGDVIIKKAAAESGSLIAIATHDRSGIDRWLLGSVAEKVMRGTMNPLLLVRAEEGAQTTGEAILKTVIVPLDGSPLAERALPHAIDLATMMDLELLLVRAFSLSETLSGYDDYVDWNKLETAVKDEAARYLDRKKGELKQPRLVKISPLAIEGEAAEQITNLAKRTGASLVVICSHGRSGVGRWLLGSVAERVLRHSTGPVLLVRSG